MFTRVRERERGGERKFKKDIINLKLLKFVSLITNKSMNVNEI